jgi:hypothetical protein
MAQTTSQMAWIAGLSAVDPPRCGLEFLPLGGRKSSANDLFERPIAHYMDDSEVRKRPDWPAGLLLGLQHRVWRPHMLDAWMRAGMTTGSRVVDIGSGPGYASLDAAEVVGPDGEVVGSSGPPIF